MKLRDYQINISKLTVDLLNKYKIAYLAMEPRCGKTLTALETCHLFGAKKVLFVTKKKAIGSITSDCLFYPQLLVTVTNYEQVSKMIDDFDVIIIDEAHSIGAFPKPSLRAKMLKEVCINKLIIFLSGTPTPESWSQLYHQFWVSSFSPFKEYINFYKWAKDYVTIKKKYVFNREINDYSDANIEKIKKDTEILFLNYTQKQAGFTQEVTELFMSVPMPDHLKESIKTLKKDKVWNNVIADTAVKEMSKVHQMCSGTVISEDGEYIILSYFKAKAIFNQFNGKRIGIFYKFKSEFEMLKNIFDWTDSPEIFQSGEKSVFLGQFISAREGVRLDTADALIFFNIDFSYLSYEQAKNRLMSKDRINPAPLYWCFSDCGVEKRIFNTVKNKQDFTLQHYVRKTISN